MHIAEQYERQFGADNYAPLPVVLTRGEGVHVWDDTGKCYLDMMSAYSAVSHGHCHPELVDTLITQARRLAVTSRAFYTDRLGELLKKACQLTGQARALPMNTGAEAVETALKAARKWAYTVKRVAPDRAHIIACENNFHGRTIAIVSMSSEAQYRNGFGAFPPGFSRIPYGDAAALRAAITPETAAFLVEPIQGEGGICLPPRGWLRECATICREHNVLLIVDEIQTGLGRTGKLLACEHEGVLPDGLLLGKALGGGLLPVSLFLSRADVMAVFTPGDHGSTFGGNPLAASVASKALDILLRDDLPGRAAELGAYFMHALRALDSPLVAEVRGQGLMIGLAIEAHPTITAREICLRLMAEGVLAKETHGTIIRLTPPLVITREQIDQAVVAIGKALQALAGSLSSKVP